MTLPLEHVRGRYSLGMYKQMDITELVAKDTHEFVDVALKLLTNHTFRQHLSERILERFHRDDQDYAMTKEDSGTDISTLSNSGDTIRLNKNKEAAAEWVTFFKTIMR